MQVNVRFRKLSTSCRFNITLTRTRIRALKKSFLRSIMHTRFYPMNRKGKTMTCLETRRAILDLKQATLGIRVDIVISRVVGQDKVSLASDQETGRVRAAKEVLSHSLFLLVVWWPELIWIGLDDIFGNFFGGGSNFGGFGSSTSSQSGSRSPPKKFRAINSHVFNKEITDQGMTWLLLSYTPSLKGNQYLESIVEEVVNSLEGALKVGSINCEKELSFCKELGVFPRRAPTIFVYSYKENEKGSLVEYNGDLDVKSLKSFCQEQLPRFSKRTGLNQVDSSGTSGKLPMVMLLSTKKDTPVIWRVLSGLYHKHLTFSDAEVHDFSDPRVKKLGVDALPAIVGWLPNGEKHILKAGVSVKNLKSAVDDLSIVLDRYIKLSKKAASSQARKMQTDSDDGQIPLLTQSNFGILCGEQTPVCIIGVFRSSGAQEKLKSLLSLVSQKSLSRRLNSVSSSRDSVSYTLLDATKQPSFLYAFDKAGFKSSDKLLVAYKPRKGKFATFVGGMTTEEVESFISSVLNGDIPFRETRQKPMLK
ncbi:dnaJ protein ERDJ3A [Quillaja saponaria]|uniref:DnaJ protein ERDJ3A n=1 Tax=Quillaja saponaria TaxID=32244 RepID=A0AAD7LNI9_QUISA|nr:dnaJ protein ERDJ3A [Quillaja saponaria]